jgi:hypothetical protein
MNPKADIFRKCFNGNLKNMQRFNEFNKVSNIFINSYLQNIISISKTKIKDLIAIKKIKNKIKINKITNQHLKIKKDIF